MTLPSERLVNSIVSLPPGNYMHTAIAGNVLAIGRCADSDEHLCLVSLGEPVAFRWFPYVDGEIVRDEGERVRAAIDPGYLIRVNH